MAVRRTGRTTNKDVPTMRELMERRGLSVSELAERTGYSPDHVRRVMRGEHPGSKRFHVQMEGLLGGKYRLGEQLTWDEKLLPKGFWGNNDLESVMKAQGITKPQGWPPPGVPKVTKEEADAFVRAIEEGRRASRELARQQLAEEEE